MPIEYTCIICGKIKKVPPSTYKRSHKYCSRKCCGVGNVKYNGKKKCTFCKHLFDRNTKFFYRNKSTGDKLTTECKNCARELSRKDAHFKRDFVKKKGSYCEKCGFKSDVISFFEIDHIIPVGLSNQKRLSFRKEDGKNLQVLCPNCHKLKTIEDNKKIRNKFFERDRNIIS